MNDIGWIEEGAAGGFYFLEDAGFQIDHDGTRDVGNSILLAELAEESVHTSLGLNSVDGLAGGEVDAMLLTDGFPETGSDLNTSLADRNDDIVINFHGGLV